MATAKKRDKMNDTLNEIAEVWNVLKGPVGLAAVWYFKKMASSLDKMTETLIKHEERFERHEDRIESHEKRIDKVEDKIFQ